MAATAEKKKGKGDLDSLAVIVSHEARAQMWYVLAERVASPKELAAMLGRPLNECAYHCRVLAEAGLLELVEEIPRRGAVEHRWRAIQRPEITDEQVAGMTDEEAITSARSVFQMAFADTVRALASRSILSRPDHWAARLAGRLDDEGFAEVNAGLEAALEVFYSAEQRTKERVAAGKTTTTFPVSGLASFFEVPERVSN